MRILFLHGLEGSPYGNKARWLRANYNVSAPSMNTQAARQALASITTDWSDTSVPTAIFEAPIRSATAELNDDTQLVIGSSFGGAVLAELVRKDVWLGPCIFLASAHVKLSPLRAFKGQSICIHGDADTVIPAQPIQRFVSNCGAPHEFWLVKDDHRLKTILTDNTLRQAIEHLIM